MSKTATARWLVYNLYGYGTSFRGIWQLCGSLFRSSSFWSSRLSGASSLVASMQQSCFRSSRSFWPERWRVSSYASPERAEGAVRPVGSDRRLKLIAPLTAKPHQRLRPRATSARTPRRLTADTGRGRAARTPRFLIVRRVGLGLGRAAPSICQSASEMPVGRCEAPAMTDQLARRPARFASPWASATQRAPASTNRGEGRPASQYGQTPALRNSSCSADLTVRGSAQPSRRRSAAHRRRLQQPALTRSTGSRVARPPGRRRSP